MAARRDFTRESLAAGVRAGDRRALARAITLVENSDPLAYEVVQDLYYYHPRNAGERLSHEFFLSRGRQVFLEDMNTLEAQHAVLSSGVLSHLQLSQQEMSLMHHYKVSREMLDE